LLHSLISKKIVKNKFPGYSYVAVSSAGFKVNKENKVDPSDIVWVEEPISDGNPMETNDVLIPCRYKIEGKDIDLIKDGYAIQDKDGYWKLNKDKISDELLKIISF
jgi:hypothetical protein